MTLSQLALEDVEALCLGTSFPMADPMGPLLDQNEEEALSPSFSLEGKAPASPSLSLSSYTSSLSLYQTMSFSPLSSSTPPTSPPYYTNSSSYLGTKTRADDFSLFWLNANNLLDAHVGADVGKNDSLVDMDWMAEKIDLSEFDLDSLIGSCSSDESPSSPEDLLASLDSHMDLDLDSFDTTIPIQNSSLEVNLSLPNVPSLSLETPLPVTAETKTTEAAPAPEVVIKSEPISPSPPSPAYTLELGSEEDTLDAEKTTASLTATIIPDPSGNIQTTPILLSIPTSGHIVVVVEPSLLSTPSQTVPPTDSDSDSGIESSVDSPPHLPSPSAGSSRTKPYSKSEPITSPKVSKVKLVSGTPKVVEKKLKKMEQNKTAATRYRQKKREEQELLNVEREELEKKNHELTEKAESINREIQYLKDLMEEVRKHHRGKTNMVA